MKTCKGCGAVFQTDNKDATGYVKSLDHEYCFRCFNLRNFNLNLVSIDDDAINTLVTDLQEYKTIAVVIDIFGFSFLNELKKYGLIDHNIVLIINKFDLLPKSINEQRISNWISEVFDELNILRIIFTSANKKFNVDNTLHTLQKVGGEIPIIGRANVGKSSLINAMKKSIDPEDESLITISYYPGTTLDKVEWQVDERLKIIDTPGITFDHEYISQLSKESLKLFFPKTETKPTTFQLQNGQSIFVNGFILCNFLNSNPMSVTYYFSNEFNLHRCKTKNVEELVTKHRGVDVIVPPFKEELEKMEFKNLTITVTKEVSEIEFANFGWIDVHTDSDVEIEILVPISCDVTLRKPMYKENSGQ